MEVENRIRDDVTSSPVNFRLIFAAVVLNLNAIVFGAGIAFTSPALPDMMSSGGRFRLTSEEASWMASVYPLGSLVGSLVGSYFVDKYGRKFTVIHSAIVHVTGWLVITTAWNASCLYVGRIVTGYAAGIVMISVPVYLGEVTPAKQRGMYTSCYGLCMSVGILLMNFLGCFLRWRWLAVSCIALLAVQTCLVVFIPESPRYLLNSRRRKLALESFDWFLPSSNPNDFRQLEEDIVAGGGCKQVKFSDIRHKSIYKPMLLAASMWLVQFTTGIDYIWFYTVTIFRDAGVHVAFSSNGEAVITSALCVAGGVVSSFLFDRAGRRILLMVSASTCSICMFALGLHFNLKVSNPPIAERLALLPVTSVAAFQFFYSIGLAAGPAVIYSEIIPTRARGLSGSLACIVSSLGVFIVAKFGVTLAKSTSIHDYGLFWIFAACCVISVIFIFACLPETKGKTLEEIEKMFL